MQQLISIIVPVYNAEQYLRQCVDSLVSQTYKNIEIVLIDNGCSDLSGSICDGYAANDFRVKVVHIEKNIGVGGARNAGIKNATGDWVTFCDADDWCDAAMCENAVKHIDGEVDMLIWGLTYFNPATDQYRRNEIKDNTPAVYRGDDVKLLQLDLYSWQFDKNYTRDKNIIMGTCWGKMYKKTLLSDVVFQDGISPYEDSLFNFQAFEQADKVILLYESYNFYRYVDNSIVHRYRSDNEHLIQKTIAFLHNCISKNTYQADWRFSLAFSTYCLHLFTILIINTLHKDNSDNFRSKIDTLKRNLNNGLLRDEILNFPKYSKPKTDEKLWILLIKLRFWRLLFLLYRLKYNASQNNFLYKLYSIIKKNK